jgi:hypothetical protein
LCCVATSRTIKNGIYKWLLILRLNSYWFFLTNSSVCKSYIDKFIFRFLCQASSMDFLSKQNFDFNKLFKEGISYLKSDDEKKLRDSVDEKREMRRQSNQVFSVFTLNFISIKSLKGNIFIINKTWVLHFRLYLCAWNFLLFPCSTSKIRSPEIGGETFWLIMLQGCTTRS